MKQTLSQTGLALLLLFVAAAGSAQEPVQVRHWSDRSALFPGDSLTYRVEIRIDPRFDILPEELQPAQLQLTGLEVLSFEHQRSESGDGVRHSLRYRLTTYEVVPAALRIAERRIPYYSRRPGQGLEGGSPAGTLSIPALDIALRSTLPGEAGDLSLRDQDAAVMLSGGGTWLGPAGWVLILLAVVPVALWAVPGLRRHLAGLRQRRRSRPQPAPGRGLVDVLLELDVDSEEARRSGYERLEQALRSWLTETTGEGAQAMTAAELAARLQVLTVPAAAGDLGQVLDDCERARYGGSGQLPAGTRFREAVAALQGLLAGD